MTQTYDVPRLDVADVYNLRSIADAVIGPRVYNITYMPDATSGTIYRGEVYGFRYELEQTDMRDWRLMVVAGGFDYLWCVSDVATAMREGRCALTPR